MLLSIRIETTEEQANMAVCVDMFKKLLVIRVFFVKFSLPWNNIIVRKQFTVLSRVLVVGFKFSFLSGAEIF